MEYFPIIIMLVLLCIMLMLLSKLMTPIKFYTDEGIWDIVGNNTPVFFERDPLKFPDFVHSQKRDPQTGYKNRRPI